MTKHTPGPWVADRVHPDWGATESPCAVRYVDGPHRQDICTLYGPSHKEATANARLIAAAPELLEALQHFLGRMELSGNWDDGCFYYSGTAAPELQDVIYKAREVVKKAAA